MDNGFGYSLIDKRGNEEAFWQKLDRGDVKRSQFGEFLQRDSLYAHVVSRRIHVTSGHAM